MQKLLLLAIGFVAGASLALTGCLALKQESETKAVESVEASQDKVEQAGTTISTVCIVRNRNAKLADDTVVKAIAAGVEKHGVKTRAVAHDQIPQDCRLCLYYGVTSENGKTKSFDFQAVLDGKALKRGSGAVSADGNIKIQTIADYAYNYLKSIIVSKAGEAKTK